MPHWGWSETVGRALSRVLHGKFIEIRKMVTKYLYLVCPSNVWTSNAVHGKALSKWQKKLVEKNVMPESVTVYIGT